MNAKVPTLAALKREVHALRDPARAKFLQGFFRTGPGEYAEGDRMLGLTVPASRQVARAFRGLLLDDLAALLASEWHEHRLIALLILIDRHARAPLDEQQVLHRVYLDHLDRVNHWDLVDLSAKTLLGEHDRDGLLAAQYAQSRNLWHRRIAIVSTFASLRAGDVSRTFTIADMLLDDPHELIHKATGWLLREAGKVDQAALLGFLRTHYVRLPRTALRYAIERMDPVDRKLWLAGPR